MSALSQQIYDDILDRVDLVQLIGEYMQLRKAGASYLGLCPFHGEKTPSFNVNPNKRLFHCFGCQKGGNAFTFLQEIEGLSFREALERLASRTGVVLPEGDFAARKRSEQKQNEPLLALNRSVLEFYCRQLSSSREAREYLVRRGVFEDTCVKHQLGYAPNSWSSLTDHLRRSGVQLSLAESLGLIGVSKKTGNYYDVFRHRVIFPVLSVVGDVLGFSGRTLETQKDIAKYINSAESVIFKKGESVLGLGLARQAIRKHHRAVLVEGNFDYLTLQEKGIEEAVAPMGTSLGELQLRLLRRLSAETVILMFDADGAGQKALMKAIPMVLKEGLFPRVLQLPKGEDPHSFAMSREPAEVRAFVDGAEDALSFVIDKAARETYGDVPRRAAAAEEIASFVSLLQDEVARDLYIQMAVSRLGVTEGLIASRVQRAKSSYVPPSKLRTETRAEGPQHELYLAAFLLHHAKLRSLARSLGVAQAISHAGLREFVARVQELAPDASVENLLDSLTDDGIKQALRRLWLQPSGLDEEANKAEQRLRQSVGYLYRQIYERREHELTEAIREASYGQDKEKILALVEEKLQLCKEKELVLRQMSAKTQATA